MPWNYSLPINLSLSCYFQQNVKDEIVRSTEKDTIHIFRTLNNTARVHKNSIAKEVVRLERRPGEHLLHGD